jgi:hypothetical protein
MTVAPTTPAARAPRAPQPDSADEHALAVRTAAFDIQAKEQAEDEREREALEQLVQAQLKFEDEIMKKWIAMIG